MKRRDEMSADERCEFAEAKNPGDDPLRGDRRLDFGLSKLASLIGTHLVAPLHLLLFIPFIELGVHLFHTRKLPMDRKQLEHLSHHPLRLFHAIWQWEWHALIVWGLVAAIVMPMLAMYLRRALILLLRRNRTLVRSTPATR